jgi:hypothetical protein
VLFTLLHFQIEGGQTKALKAGSEMKLGHHPTVWKLEQMKVAVSNLQGSLQSDLLIVVCFLYVVIRLITRENILSGT